MNLKLRRATPDESEALTKIAHAAKRHWGYPEKWIERWRPELTLTPQFISGNEVFVAEMNGEIAGCCALVVSGSLAELEHMWIDPQRMGKGVGRALFDHVKQRAKDLNFPSLELSADPNAEGFYKRMGAERIGEVPADLDGQPRVLPRMRIKVEP